MRLDSDRREYQMSFVADIDGFIRIMQEVDTAKDPRVKVKMKRTICPDLGWREWLTRKFHGMLTWQTTLKFSQYGGRRPETASGKVGVVMLIASGKSADTQWFDYRPGYFS